MPLLPGEILHKRYRIIHLLAEGAYGAVYRAWDIKDRRNYAIKEYLNPSLEIQPLFREEARRLSGLKHPQLPAFHDHFVLEDKGQYLVSDYVDGVDLQSLLRQYGTLPEDLIIHWLQAVCKPVAYLHEKGTVHLNIKPANIRLTPSGELFLVDSGWVALGVSAGNLGYASPEQANQKEATPASDIYSLGATLYTLLTNIVPPDALRRQSGLVTLKPARELNPDVSPYLSLVAQRAMDLRPDVRYESAADFAQALERTVGQGVVPAFSEYPRRTSTSIPPTSPPRLPYRSRRQMEQRTILGLVGIFLLILLLGLASLRFGKQQQLSGGNEVAATATTQSQIIAALTQLAPTHTPVPPATETTVPTPAPLIEPKTGMRMIFVPAGLFRLGNDDGERDERPSLMVKLDNFYLDETEVTNEQYQKCVESGACTPPIRSDATYHSAYYGSSDYANYPVIFVNWYQAQTFCQWRDARLPTEAEWERAASFDADTLVKTKYPWGDEFDGNQLNYCSAGCPRSDADTSIDDGHRDTAPVGSYPDGRSPAGIYDMLGNVSEWVNDWYDSNYYETATTTNPMGAPEGITKVFRGGSWLTPLEDISNTLRGNYDPLVFQANIGFRCALTP